MCLLYSLTPTDLAEIYPILWRLKHYIILMHMEVFCAQQTLTIRNYSCYENALVYIGICGVLSMNDQMLRQ